MGLFIHFAKSAEEDGAVKIEWPVRSYLNRRYDGLWCYSFDEHAQPQTILGISWVLHRDAIFDLANGRFGIADATCPEYSKVPRLWERRSGILQGLQDRAFLKDPASLATCCLVFACIGLAFRCAR